MLNRRTYLVATVVMSVLGMAVSSESAQAQRRVQLGGPFGIGVGGGQGLTIGGGYGVQLGGGQGLRLGPPNAGVQYGGGQGVRYGTSNAGIQFGGGQVLRYGTTNAGVRIGGGEGARVGTPQSGVQYGNGNGFQVGRIYNPNFPATQVVQPSVPFQQVPVVYGNQPAYVAQPNQIAPGFQQVPVAAGVVTAPAAFPANAITNVPVSPAPIFIPSPSVQNVVPQTQFDVARQPSSTPVEALKTATEPAKDALPREGVSVLKFD